MQWFRSKADLERWKEEVIILEEEMHRICRGFDYHATLWMQIASRFQGGKAAYACRKAAMFDEMAKHAVDESNTANMGT